MNVAQRVRERREKEGEGKRDSPAETQTHSLGWALYHLRFPPFPLLVSEGSGWSFRNQKSRSLKLRSGACWVLLVLKIGAGVG